MNKIENLLVTLSEECAELAKETDKALRFGLHNVHCKKPNLGRNDTRMVTEYLHIQAVVELLQRSGSLPKLSEEEIERIKEEKISNILNWQKASIEYGTLSIDE